MKGMTTTMIREQSRDWLIQTTAKGDNSPASLMLNALLIREYGDAARRVILAKRAEYRQKNAKWQREWATKVSRRPQRGRNHDSWATREKYVRYAETWPSLAIRQP